MSFPNGTSVRSSMQMNYSKEGIVFWLAVGGKEAMIDLKAKLFSKSGQLSPETKKQSNMTALYCEATLWQTVSLRGALWWRP